MTDDIELLTKWLQGCLILAAIFTTLFPVLYSFFPWTSTLLGKLLMFQGISFALAVDTTLLFQFWVPSHIMVIFWINAIVYTMLAASTALMSWKLWQLDRRRRNEEINDGEGSPFEQPDV